MVWVVAQLSAEPEPVGDAAFDGQVDVEEVELVELVELVVSVSDDAESAEAVPSEEVVLEAVFDLVERCQQSP